MFTLETGGKQQRLLKQYAMGTHAMICKNIM